MKHIRYAKNDTLIEEIINDSRYEITYDGLIFRRLKSGLKQTGKALSNKEGKLYHSLKYKGRVLLVHRIIYRKFNGKLDPDMVVNHIDGDSQNNDKDNLELVTQELNMIAAYAV